MAKFHNGSHVIRSISEYKAAEEEEMKTLFTDPALRTVEEEGKCTSEKGSQHCSSGVGNKDKDATTMVSVASSQKEDGQQFNAASNNLMTRRITIAGGFLDIALFTANIEQLKFILELGPFYIYYRQVLGLVITSLVLQMLVGLTMFLLGCHVIKKIEDETYSNLLNHLTMGLVALVTIVNLFISAFGPKGKALSMCLGAFSIRNNSSPIWNFMMNITEPRMLVGLTMFLLGCHVIKKVEDETYSNLLNHLTMGLVALVTIVNIFITTFGPKGKAFALCLGAFSIRNNSSPIWNLMMNITEPHMLVAFIMFLLGCNVMKKVEDETYSNLLNHLTVGLVALVTTINIFISTFGPKGTALAMCLGAFSVRQTSNHLWNSMMNITEPCADFP